ncbi:YdcF family protein [Paenibacillus alkaliterrae]|uniref:YdcF family protein n=1 Tax=Paenibacillus alkaliterrae TaxID=320909 RepID=UPI001F34A8F4|nr:YdcF family protein [Paenibacillus alkaliterrae]MCF2938310.1 YdcF family protein [Paenibacillus alkaliterrae]
MIAATSRRSRPRKRTKKTRPRLLLFRVAAWLICAGVFWCGYLLWLINGYDTSKPLLKADAGIVLGAALWNDVPSPALKERLDFALHLYEVGIVDKLILSGGLGANGSTKTEAAGMRDYLVMKGISADKLLLESDATSTYENLRFSQKIANEKKLSKLVVITHDYHAARAKEVAKQLDFEHFQIAATKSKVLNPVYNESREVLAFTKWKLDRLLLSLGIRSSDTML